MIKRYIKWKWEWVDNNPRKSVWISWLKGIVTGIIISVFLL